MNFKHEYQGESLPFEYQKGDVKLFFHGDSKDKIYKSKFSTTREELKPALETLSEYIHNKSIDELKQSFANQFEHQDKFMNLSLVHFKTAIGEYAGSLNSEELVNSNELICRCSKVDFNQLEVNYIKNYGDLKLVKKQTNASMICGSCTKQVEKIARDLTVKHQVYEGKSLAEWTLDIEKMLEEFSLFSPAEFDSTVITISKLELPKIELLIKIPHQSLTEELAAKSLTNYLAKELQQPIEVKVTFDIAFSN